MGQISSGIGLISGINFSDLIDQLLAIEARPITIVETQNGTLSSQQVALQEINSRLLAFKLSAGSLTSSSLVNARSAISSDETALTVSAKSSATAGSHSFLVDRLVTSQQILTEGFADLNDSPLAAGRLTFEFGAARLDSDTELINLNGGDGAARGTIRITDRSGASANIDLSRALTLKSVLGTINGVSDIDVTASANGDALQIVDNTGGTSNLSVTEVGGGTTATDLGIKQSVAASTLAGTQINRIRDDSHLATLNDGNGVRILNGNDDFKVTLKTGSTFNVNLHTRDNFSNNETATRTIENLIATIHQAADNAGFGGQIATSVNSAATGLTLEDNSGGNGTFSVTTLNGSKAAADLGIQGSTSGTTIAGNRIIAHLNSRLNRYLQGGNGIDLRGTLEITDRSGILHTITGLAGLESVDEVISQINAATPATITAALSNNGNGITITDTTAGSQDLEIRGTIAESNGLNLAGRYRNGMAHSGNLQRQYITEATLVSSLNGGRGIRGSTFDVRDSAGTIFNIQFTKADHTTVGDVIEAINQAQNNGINLSDTASARINDHGDGILIEDTNGRAQIVAMTVTEKGSNTAADLGILGAAPIPGGDLEGSYEKSINIASVPFLTAATDLNDLNQGKGVSRSSGVNDILIKTQAGIDVPVNFDGATTIAALQIRVNTGLVNAGLSNNDVAVSINATGDGLDLTDTTTGNNIFSVSPSNGSEAGSDLGIIKSDDDGDGVITGSRVSDIQTLAHVLQQINDANIPINATVIHDGSPTNPYRLVFSSDHAGSEGQFVFDDAAELTSSTLVADLNDGNGIDSVVGTDLAITLKNGTPISVDLSEATTINDVLAAINVAPSLLKATINETGTGLVLEDKTFGTSLFTITQSAGSTAAHALDILQSDIDNDGFIRGGQIVSPTLNFSTSTLAEAADALIFYGSDDPAKGIALTSTSNTFANVVPGLTIDALTRTTSPVTVSVTRDDSGIANEINNFVDNFNAVIDAITEHDSYNAETETRGLLLGDPTIATIRRLMYRLVSGRNNDVSGDVRSLSQIGIRVGAGSRLTFDQSKFDNVFATNRADIEELLTLKKMETNVTTGRFDLMQGGIMAQFENLIGRFTDGIDGTIQMRVNAIDQQIELGNDRIAGLRDRIDARRRVLEAEFLLLERTLASLQSQSSALYNLRPITTGAQGAGGSSLFGV